MTDAQIKLYAALRVAVPPGWRIRGQSGQGPFFASMLRVTFTASYAYRVLEYAMLVPEDMLEERPAPVIRLAVARATTEIQRVIKREVAAPTGSRQETRAEFVRRLVDESPLTDR